MTGPHRDDDGDATTANSTDTTAGRQSTDLAISAPARSTNDEAIQVRVSGLSPGESVTIEASLVADDAVEWRSRTTFEADSDGVVDLTRDAPTAGTYDGVEPMGWLWSMHSQDNETRMPSLSETAVTPVTFEARTDARRATQCIERVVYDDGIASRQIDRDDLVGTLYEPPGEGPYPAVVHLHGSAGRLIHGTPRALASQGYATVALSYFGDGDPGGHDHESIPADDDAIPDDFEAIPDDHRSIPLEYFDGVVDWLREQPGVDAERVGLVGVSRGAELALVLAGRRDWVGAVVSYAGSGVPWDTPSGDPAWTDDGEPVPHFVAEPTPGATVAAGLDDDEIERVATRVERANAPILLLSGGADEVWQARDLSEIAIDRLDDHAYEHDYEHRTYDDVGHYIGRPSLPVGELGDLETMRATAHASEDSWPVALQYLDIGLRREE